MIIEQNSLLLLKRSNFVPITPTIICRFLFNRKDLPNFKYSIWLHKVYVIFPIADSIQPEGAA